MCKLFVSVTACRKLPVGNHVFEAVESDVKAEDDVEDETKNPKNP